MKKLFFLFCLVLPGFFAFPESSPTLPVDLSLQKWKVPQGGAELSAETDVADLPAGSVALHLVAPPKGFVYTASGQLPENLQEMSSFGFRVFRGAEAGKSSTIDVNFYEQGGRANFWRKITFDHQGWKEIRIPLAWMRWGKDATPNWKNIRQLGIYCRDDLDIYLTDFSFHPGPSRPTTAELQQLAFQDEAENAVAVESDQMLLLTDKTGADSDAIEAWVAKHLAVVQRDFPSLQADPIRKPVLIVFAGEKDYRQFPPRFADMHNSEMSMPTSGGYTFMGVATSFWNERYGAERPVFGHEFIHAWLELAAGLPSGSGDWVQEGIANYVQIEVTPQENLGEIILMGIEDENLHLPLQALCSGKQVPMNRYWQALSFIRFLKEKYPEQLPELFAAIQETRKTDLALHLNILGTDWPGLTREWKAWCRETYAPVP